MAAAADIPQLYIKGNWALPYTFERLNQALHRADDDPLPLRPQLRVCGIGKATAMVAIVHNLIKEQQQNGSWRDFTLHHLDTKSIRNSAKVRTQLAFELTAAAAPAANAL